jgi:hypothetical protein
VKQHLQGVRLEKLHTLVFHIWQECSRNKDKVAIFSPASNHLFVWRSSVITGMPLLLLKKIVTCVAIKLFILVGMCGYISLITCQTWQSWYNAIDLYKNKQLNSSEDSFYWGWYSSQVLQPPSPSE